MLIRLGFSLKYLVIDIIALYELVIAVRCLLSFISPESRGYYLTERVTEPVLYPVRSALSRVIGSFRLDFSPAVAIALLEGVRRVIDSLFR